MIADNEYNVRMESIFRANAEEALAVYREANGAGNDVLKKLEVAAQKYELLPFVDPRDNIFSSLYSDLNTAIAQLKLRLRTTQQEFLNTWDVLTVNIENLDGEALINNWRFLVGEDMSPILITLAGDMFLKSRDRTVSLLRTMSGQLDLVADTYEKFQPKLADSELVEFWFNAELIEELRQDGTALNTDELYGFRRSTGGYCFDNFEPWNVETHFDSSGCIHSNYSKERTNPRSR